MKALLVVDVQNDFVGGNEDVILVINELMQEFELVVASKDWHPRDHCSFAKWPVHCVQGSYGAQFPEGLNVEKIDKVFLKGQDRDKEAYSAFNETGLYEFLKEKGVIDLYICGIAREYCVKYSAEDAKKLGFTVHIVERACRSMV